MVDLSRVRQGGVLALFAPGFTAWLEEAGCARMERSSSCTCSRISAAGLTGRSSRQRISTPWRSIDSLSIGGHPGIRADEVSVRAGRRADPCVSPRDRDGARGESVSAGGARGGAVGWL